MEYKQYYITSGNILQDSPDDCYLAPEDPIQVLKIASHLGGLGSEQRLAEYNQSLKQPIMGSDKGRLAREKNIRAGTPEWFQHWFGN